MTRIVVAENKLHLARYKIVDDYCPCCIDNKLPDFDIDTFKFSDVDIECGCRGIDCEECWDMPIGDERFNNERMNKNDERLHGVDL